MKEASASFPALAPTSAERGGQALDSHAMTLRKAGL